MRSTSPLVAEADSPALRCADEDTKRSATNGKIGMS